MLKLKKLVLFKKWSPFLKLIKSGKRRIEIYLIEIYLLLDVYLEGLLMKFLKI